MFNNSFIFYSGKIIVEIITDIIYFPAWWYTRGLVNLLSGVKDFLVSKQKALALFVWIKNIFTPMYGQYDWVGRLISFLVRVVQIFFRSIFMLGWLMVGLAVVIFWLVFPIIVINEIIFQII